VSGDADEIHPFEASAYTREKGSGEKLWLVRGDENRYIYSMKALSFNEDIIPRHTNQPSFIINAEKIAGRQTKCVLNQMQERERERRRKGKSRK
jgi:hypothetical protein